MLYQLLEWFRSQEKEEGQTLVEYALIIALIAIVLIVALQSLEVGIGDVFTRIIAGFTATGPVE